MISYAWGQLLIGLLAVHGALLYFYLCGSVLRARRFAPAFDERALTSGQAVLDIVVAATVGMVLTGFAAFVLGIGGALYWPAFVGWLAIPSIASALGGEPVVGREFWLRRARVWRRAVSPGSIILYALALVIAVPALIPDIGSDGTMYHTAYAYDWAVAHRIYVDFWLPLPYYANNWLLIETVAIVLGGLNDVQFLTWLGGLLSLFGVYGFVLAYAPPALSRPRVRELLGLCAAFAVLASPTFLRFVNSGQIDVPIGLFFLAFCLTAVRACATGDRIARIELVLTGAFFIGMKISFPALLPLGIAALWFSFRPQPGRARGALLAVAAFLVLSSPWYVKNFIQAGDPVSPSLNVLLHGADLKYSRIDYREGVGSLTATPHDPLTLLTLPIALFATSSPQPSQDFGESLLILCLFVPQIVVVYALSRRLPPNSPLLMAAFFLVYVYAYWTESAPQPRYALMFYPLLGAFAALALAQVTQRLRRGSWIAIAALLVFAIPSPSAATWLQMVRNDTYGHLDWYTGRDAWLEPRSPGYQEIAYVADVFDRCGCNDLRLYRLNLEVTALFGETKGVQAIGGWFGPDRYSDFEQAVESDDMQRYVERFRIGAFLIPAEHTIFTPDDYSQLDIELGRLGFERRRIADRPYVMYFAPSARVGLTKVEIK